VLHSAPQTIGFHVERIKTVLGFATTPALIRHAVLLSVSDSAPPPTRRRGSGGAS
jgi:hypothetical protein